MPFATTTTFTTSHRLVPQPSSAFILLTSMTNPIANPLPWQQKSRRSRFPMSLKDTERDDLLVGERLKLQSPKYRLKLMVNALSIEVYNLGING
ncbi:hypothetical protein LXL04_012779 [Taraxacum kok-saghyz]